MAYQVRKAKEVDEILELVDNNDKVVDSIPVHINVNDMAMSINKARNDIIRAQEKFNNASDDDIEELKTQLGEAVLALFRLIFGEDGTERICKFYESNYTTMMNYVFPFIAEVVLPALESASIAERENMAKNFKLSHSMRRKYKI